MGRIPLKRLLTCVGLIGCGLGVGFQILSTLIGSPNRAFAHNRGLLYFLAFAPSALVAFGVALVVFKRSLTLAILSMILFATASAYVLPWIFNHVHHRLF